jgi:Mn2+/Fe2+ NRAMP family transporter
MSSSQQPLDNDRQRLLEAQAKGPMATLGAYIRMSGPGWLQSAITLGGGSLAGSLYLGVVAGFAFLWVQPLAMILGIIMLSAMAYVTLSTQERPFRAINQHVNPVLGWGWALASLAANMFWCLPQYGLATSVVEQNLLPGVVGSNGSLTQWFAASYGSDSWLASNGSTLVVVGVILLFSTIVTWSYNSGSWGIKLYEFILKLMVAGIVLCFFGVIFAIRNDLNWGEMFAGFIPDISTLWHPSARFQPILEVTAHADYWRQVIISEQRDMIVGAAATAVGINMTFLFPYSLLRKRWTKEFRGLVRFDLATGMFIPFVLATSCVVIAAAQSFHTQTVPGFLGETDAEGKPIVASQKERNDFYNLLKPLVQEMSASENPPAEWAQLPTVDDLYNKALAGLSEADRKAITKPTEQALKADFEREITWEKIDRLPESDRRIASMLINRSAADLSHALEPLAGAKVANLIFGLGVLGMTLSTITILMLISGFVIVEIFDLPENGWGHRLGCLAAATGALGPFIWAEAAFRLAVYVSAFGLMLLPIAYLTFFFMMNQRSLLKDDMPRGFSRLAWNTLMFIAVGIATVSSVYVVWTKLSWGGISAYIAFILLAVIVGVVRRKQAAKGFEPPY